MTETEHATGQTRSKLNGKWLGRMMLITIVLLGFGGWGFYDALVVYPNRGKSYAEFQQREYLQAAQRAGRMREASIIDPAGELDRLKDADVLQLSEFDRARRAWLEALAVPGMGALNTEYTMMDDPVGELTRLTEKFQTEEPKKPLSGFDILTQWAICAVCWALALYLILLVLLVRSRTYRWDAASTTLTTPDGTEITPADLDPEDPADLSKWKKFIVMLRPRAGHATLKAPVRFDVFRYTPVEDWLRVLVKTANPEIEFPDEVKAREEAEALAEAERDAATDDTQDTDDDSESPADDDR